MICFYIELYKDDEWILDVYCKNYPQEQDIMKAVYDNDADYGVVTQRYYKLPFA